MSDFNYKLETEILPKIKDIRNLQILELGVELDVDAITVSGDILHSVRPTASTINFLKTCQDYLKKHNKPCLVSIGNHDLSVPHWVSNLSDGSTSGFKVLDDELYVLDSGVAVYGKTFCSREEFDAGGCVPKSTDVLLMHQSFSELTNFPNDKSFSFSDFENLEVPVVIIGDTHIHQSFDMDGMQICSPGSSELMSEPESEDKFVYLCESSDGKTWNIEPQSIPTRKVIRLHVQTEDELTDAMQLIKANEEQQPLVFLRFSTELDDVLTRVRKQIDTSKTILRPKPIQRIEGVDYDKNDELDLTFSDILKEFIPNNPQQFEAVSQLLNPDAEVHSIIDSYVDTRIKALTDEL